MDCTKEHPTGVTYHKPMGKWEAKIRVDGKYRFLGYFDNIDDAIKARQIAAETIRCNRKTS